MTTPVLSDEEIAKLINPVEEAKLCLVEIQKKLTAGTETECEQYLQKHGSNIDLLKKQLELIEKKILNKDDLTDLLPAEIVTLTDIVPLLSILQSTLEDSTAALFDISGQQEEVKALAETTTFAEVKIKPQSDDGCKLAEFSLSGALAKEGVKPPEDSGECKKQFVESEKLKTDNQVTSKSETRPEDIGSNLEISKILEFGDNQGAKIPGPAAPKNEIIDAKNKGTVDEEKIRLLEVEEKHISEKTEERPKDADCKLVETESPSKQEKLTEIKGTDEPYQIKMVVERKKETAELVEGSRIGINEDSRLEKLSVGSTISTPTSKEELKSGSQQPPSDSCSEKQEQLEVLEIGEALAEIEAVKTRTAELENVAFEREPVHGDDDDITELTTAIESAALAESKDEKLKLDVPPKIDKLLSEAKYDNNLEESKSDKVLGTTNSELDQPKNVSQEEELKTTTAESTVSSNKEERKSKQKSGETCSQEKESSNNTMEEKLEAGNVILSQDAAGKPKEAMISESTCVADSSKIQTEESGQQSITENKENIGKEQLGGRNSQEQAIVHANKQNIEEIAESTDAADNPKVESLHSSPTKAVEMQVVSPLDAVDTSRKSLAETEKEIDISEKLESIADKVGIENLDSNIANQPNQLLQPNESKIDPDTPQLLLLKENLIQHSNDEKADTNRKEEIATKTEVELLGTTTNRQAQQQDKKLNESAKMVAEEESKVQGTVKKSTELNQDLKIIDSFPEPNKLICDVTITPNELDMPKIFKPNADKEESKELERVTLKDMIAKPQDSVEKNVDDSITDADYLCSEKTAPEKQIEHLPHSPKELPRENVPSLDNNGPKQTKESKKTDAACESSTIDPEEAQKPSDQALQKDFAESFSRDAHQQRKEDELNEKEKKDKEVSKGSPGEVPIGLRAAVDTNVTNNLEETIHQELKLEKSELDLEKITQPKQIADSTTKQKLCQDIPEGVLSREESQSTANKDITEQLKGLEKTSHQDQHQNPEISVNERITFAKGEIQTDEKVDGIAYQAIVGAQKIEFIEEPEHHLSKATQKNLEIFESAELENPTKADQLTLEDICLEKENLPKTAVMEPDLPGKKSKITALSSTNESESKSIEKTEPVTGETTNVEETRQATQVQKANIATITGNEKPLCLDSIEMEKEFTEESTSSAGDATQLEFEVKYKDEKQVEKKESQTVVIPTDMKKESSEEKSSKKLISSTDDATKLQFHVEDKNEEIEESECFAKPNETSSVSRKDDLGKHKAKVADIIVDPNIDKRLPEELEIIKHEIQSDSMLQTEPLETLEEERGEKHPSESTQPNSALKLEKNEIKQTKFTKSISSLEKDEKQNIDVMGQDYVEIMDTGKQQKVEVNNKGIKDAGDEKRGKSIQSQSTSTCKVEEPQKPKISDVDDDVKMSEIDEIKNIESHTALSNDIKSHEKNVDLKAPGETTLQINTDDGKLEKATENVAGQTISNDFIEKRIDEELNLSLIQNSVNESQQNVEENIKDTKNNAQISKQSTELGDTEGSKDIVGDNTVSTSMVNLPKKSEGTDSVPQEEGKSKKRNSTGKVRKSKKSSKIEDKALKDTQADGTDQSSSKTDIVTDQKDSVVVASGVSKKDENIDTALESLPQSTNNDKASAISTDVAKGKIEEKKFELSDQAEAQRTTMSAVDKVEERGKSDAESLVENLEREGDVKSVKKTTHGALTELKESESTEKNLLKDENNSNLTTVTDPNVKADKKAEKTALKQSDQAQVQTDSKIELNKTEGECPEPKEKTRKKSKDLKTSLNKELDVVAVNQKQMPESSDEKIDTKNLNVGPKSKQHEKPSDKQSMETQEEPLREESIHSPAGADITPDADKCEALEKDSIENQFQYDTITSGDSKELPSKSRRKSTKKKSFSATNEAEVPSCDSKQQIENIENEKELVGKQSEKKTDTVKLENPLDQSYGEDGLNNTEVAEAKTILGMQPLDEAQCASKEVSGPEKALKKTEEKHSQISDPKKKGAKDKKVKSTALTEQQTPAIKEKDLKASEITEAKQDEPETSTFGDIIKKGDKSPSIDNVDQDAVPQSLRLQASTAEEIPGLDKKVSEQLHVLQDGSSQPEISQAGLKVKKKAIRSQPAAFNVCLTSQAVRVGNSAKLVCNVLGEHLTATWYRNEEEILENAQKYSIQNKDGLLTLEIRDVEQNDAGEYKCVVTGNGDCIQSNCQLSVFNPEDFEVSAVKPIFTRSIRVADLSCQKAVERQLIRSSLKEKLIENIEMVETDGDPQPAGETQPSPGPDERPSPGPGQDTLQVPTGKRRRIKSPTPGSIRGRSMTPVRGRSRTPFSLYMERRSATPSTWRSITPFLKRESREKTPFELGTSVKTLLDCNKAVFDKALIMDITEPEVEPVRYITTDLSVIDRAAVMDVSNVEVIYVVEEYEESEDYTEEEDKEEEQEKKKKKPKKKEKEAKPKKKTAAEKKKEEKERREKSPSPKLTLKLEMGAGPKGSKKLFEQPAEVAAPKEKPPPKKAKSKLALQMEEQAKAAAKAAEEAAKKDQEKPKRETYEERQKRLKAEKEAAEKARAEEMARLRAEEEERKQREREERAARGEESEEEENEDEGGSDEEGDESGEGEGEEGEEDEDAGDGSTVQGDTERDESVVDSMSRPESRLKLEDSRRGSSSSKDSFVRVDPEEEARWQKIAEEEGQEFMLKMRKASEIKAKSEKERHADWQKHREAARLPSFINFLTDRTAEAGNNIRLACAVDGPELSVKWFKDGRQLERDARHRISNNNNILALEVVNCETADSGEYACVISNPNDEVTSSCIVTIYEVYKDEPRPPTFTLIRDFYHLHDDELTIECHVSGIPRPKIKWIKDAFELQPNFKYTMLEEAHGVCKLMIYRPSSKDSGMYVCRASNDSGELDIPHKVEFVKEKKFHVHGVFHAHNEIQKEKEEQARRAMEEAMKSKQEYDKKRGAEEAPRRTRASVDEPVTTKNKLKFASQLRDRIALEGGKVKLVCSILGPNPNVRWLKDDKPVAFSPKVRNLSSENVGALELSDVTSDSSGVYKCIAKNEYSEIDTSCYLKVYSAQSEGDEQEPMFVLPMRDVYHSSENDLVIDTKVRGNPRPKISWLKDEMPIENDGRIQQIEHLDGVCELVINKPTPKDNGKYTCVADNKLGSQKTQHSVLLEVLPPSRRSSGSMGVAEEKEAKAKKAAGGGPDQKGKPPVKGQKKKPEDEAEGGGRRRHDSPEVSPKNKLYFAAYMTNRYLVAGSKVKLSAVVVGPDPQIKWLKDGNNVPYGPRIKNMSREGLAVLEITNAAPEDSGIYTVIARNPASEISSEALLHIYEAKVSADLEPMFTRALKDTYRLNTNELILESHVRGAPMPTVTWVKDGIELQNSEKYQVINYPDGTCELIVDKPSNKDSGKYVCQTENRAGKAEISHFVLFEGKASHIAENIHGVFHADPHLLKKIRDAEEKPTAEEGDTKGEGEEGKGKGKAKGKGAGKKGSVGEVAVVETKPYKEEKREKKVGIYFAAKLSDRVVAEGSKVKLTCYVEGPEPGVRWFKNEQPVVYGPKVRQNYREGLCTLELLSATESDSGTYQCYAKNNNGEASTECKVTVYASPKSADVPPTFTRSIKDTYHGKINELVLDCHVRGLPTPTVSWVKDGVRIEPSDKYQQIDHADGTCELIISDPVPYDSGKYVCQAENRVDKSEIAHIVQLQAKDIRPGSPSREVVRKEEAGGEKAGTDEAGKEAKEDGDKKGEEKKEKAKGGKKANAEESGGRRMAAPLPDPKKCLYFGNFLSNRTIAEGSSLRMSVFICGPDPQVRWLKDEQVVVYGPKSKSACQDGLATLVLSSLTPEDSGEYKIVARNTENEIISSCRVNVYAKSKEDQVAPVFTVGIKDTYYLNENELVLDCRIRGNPRPEVSWMKDTDMISNDSKYQQLDQADGYCKLIIREPTEKDSGTYTCRADNGVGSDKIAHVVDFKGRERFILEKTHGFFHRDPNKPHLTNNLGDHIVTAGGTVAIQAEFGQTSSPIEVQWLKDKSTLPAADNIRTFVDHGVYTLAIEKATSEMAGTYTCRASNAFGRLESNANVHIVAPVMKGGKPALFLSRPETEMKIAVHDPFSISFRVQGDPKPKLMLLKGTKEITKSDRVSKEAQEDYIRFTVHNSTISDSGTYFVIARNQHGTDRLFVTVTVKVPKK